MAPPPAMTPTGEEISEAADVMAAAIPSSMLVAVVGGKTERAMLAFADEGEDFRDGRIFRGLRLHGGQTLGKNTGAMKQLLIERPHSGEALLGELAALHADDVEAFEARILAVDEAERNDVAAHAADAADHHLRPDPRELMHSRQPADEDEVADLAVTAQRRRGRKDHVIADLAIVPDMAAVHEVAALTDPRHAAARNRAGVHGNGFADGAAGADLEPGQFAAIAQALRRGAERGERIDGAAVADHGLRGDMHMRDQPAVCADDDLGSDDAIGTDRGAIADRGAIFNPRGGIDHAH